QLDRDVRARGAVAATCVLRRAAATTPSGRTTPEPRDPPAAARRPPALPAQQLHRPLRLPRRRAARGGERRLDDAGDRVRGPARREPARALRAHAAGVGVEPRGELGRGGGRGRPGPGEGVATVHGGLGAELRGRPDAGPSGPGGSIRRRPFRAAAPSEVRGTPAAELTAPRYRPPLHSTRGGRCRDRSSSSATTR